jgi:hypothetical protein
MLPFTKRPQRHDATADDDETEALTRAHVSAPLAPLESSEGEDKTTLFPRSGGVPSASSFPVAAARASIPPARSSSVSVRPASGSVRPASGSVRPASGSVRPPTMSQRPPPPSLRPSEMSRVTTEEPAVRHGRTPVPGRSRLGLQAGPTSLSPEVARQAAYDSAFPRRGKSLESPDTFDSRSRTDSRSASVRPGERSSRDVSRSAPPSGSVYVRDQSFDRPPTTGMLRGRSATSTSMAAMAMSSPAHFMRPQSPFADAAGTSLMSGNPFGRPARTWALLLAGCAVVVSVAAAFIVRAGGAAIDATASFIEAPASYEKAEAAQATATVEAQPAAQPTVAPQAGPVPETQPGPPSSVLGASPVPTNNVAVVPSFVTPPTTATVTPTPAPTVSVTFSPITVTPPAKPAPAARPAVAWKPPPAPAPRPVAKAAPPAADDEPVVAKSSSKKGSKGGGESETERKAREALEKAQLESSF